MLQLPPGFDLSALVSDFLSISTPFATAFGCLAAFYLYKKVVNRL